MLDQEFAVELLHDAAFTVVLDKRVVLLGGSLGQWVKPVRVMGSAFLHGPFLHAGGYGVGGLAVQWRAVVDGVRQFLVRFPWKIPKHLFPVEY